MNKQIFEKMGVPKGAEAHVVNEPEGYPYDVGQNFQFKTQGDSFDFVHLFVQDSGTFPEQLAAAEKITGRDGILWVSYPKSGSDLEPEAMQQMAKPIGLHPEERISLDNDWWAVQMVQ